MLDSKFIHLRTHSSYSLAEGAIKMNKLVDFAKQNNMPAIALTDTNNMFGALEFSSLSSSSGIQPIHGLQLSITPADADNYTVNCTPDVIVLLAKNEIGYMNLMEIISNTYINNSNTLVQSTIEEIAKLSDGLICLTGGDEGSANRLFSIGQDDKAIEYLDKLHKIFSDRLYIELNRYNGYDVNIENKMLDYAFSKNIPIVATNNVFMLGADMASAHDALLCISQGLVVGQSERRKTNPDLYFKSADEMNKLFSDLPEAITNTLEIAKRCYYKANFIKPLLPEYPYLDGRSEKVALYDLTKSGLNKRLQSFVISELMDKKTKSEITKKYMDRMEYELKIINDMGFDGYFLIVADFIGWTKKNDIPVGPGRGSGAGSIVAWALNITNLDPIRFGLLFERFLNPERVSMPDFDIDFCQDRREEVISYVQKQYGRDKVAQIITFGKLQARAVVRDVGRVLSVPYGQVDRICKLIPNNPAKPVTLEQALKSELALQQEVEQDPTVEHLVNLALKLEGLYRHASTHAAGVVIGDRPLHKLVPLYQDPKSDMPATQFNMKFVEQAGLVKFDFLGLKTLTIVQMAVDLINKNRKNDKKINIDEIEIDDAQAYELMAKGNTVGVFQLESQGMRKVLMQMKPDRLEDIIAVVSLYRPGPMDNIPTYVACKHGEKQPNYLHPILESVLKETFGIPVYQEQVMQMAQNLAGYTLAGADLLRRAMGKKIQSEMDKQRQIFKDGAKNHNQVDEKLSDEIFDQINAFAGYGFNKSHAAAYALIAYQTAWLKAKYPTEFMCALMTYDIHNTDKLSVYKEDLELNDIKLLLPDVNNSFDKFSVENFEGKPAIRYSLSGLKNIGEGAVSDIVKSRNNKPFTDIYDFFVRVPYQSLNKRMVENLIVSGAFDSLYKNRKELLNNVEELLKYSQSVQQEQNSPQDNLFGSKDVEMSKPRLEQSADFSALEKINEEYKAVGFYLSAHPLSMYKDKWSRLGVVQFGDILKNKVRGDSVRLAGVVMSTRFIKTQKGKSMAIVDMADASSSYSVLFFEEAIQRVRSHLKTGEFVVVNCSKSVRDNNGDKDVRLIGNVMNSLDNELAMTADGLQIYLSNSKSIQQLKEIIDGCEKGMGIINLILDNSDCIVEMRLKGRYKINKKIIDSINSCENINEVQQI